MPFKDFDLPNVLPTSVSSAAAAIGESDELVRADHIHNFDGDDYFSDNDLLITDHEIDFIHTWGEGVAPKILGSSKDASGYTDRLFEIQADGRMLWGDGTGAADTFLSRSGPGELQISGSGDLRLQHIFQIGDGVGPDHYMYGYGAGASYPAIRTFRARGSLASPTVTSNGDQLFLLTAGGYDGAALQSAASIICKADGAWGSGDEPTRWELYTTPDGSSSVVRRMLISNAGFIMIGSGLPSAPLHVDGNVRIDSSAFETVDIYKGANIQPSIRMYVGGFGVGPGINLGGGLAVTDTIIHRGAANRIDIGIITASDDLKVWGSAFFGDDATNYSEFESDGTWVMHGNATVWDDLRIVPGAFTFAGATDPALESWQPSGAGTTFKVWKFKKNDEVFASCQLPHSYKNGSSVGFHIHWTPADRGNEEGTALVGWKVDYSWSNIDGTFGASATIDLSDACQSTDDDHLMTTEVIVSGTGKTISSIFTLRIYRSDTGADDTWTGATNAQSPALLEFDIHFEKDTVGSRLITAK